MKKLRLCGITLLLILFAVPFVAESTATKTEKKDDKKNVEVLEEISETEKRRETLLYGLDAEVISLIKTLQKEEDEQFTKELVDLFYISKNSKVKEAIVSYCIHFKIDAISKYIVTILKDPYDEKKDTVKLFCDYVKKLEVKEAAPYLKQILETENEGYFDMAIEALGVVGSSDEAVFLAAMFEEDDYLETSRKQALVKALGKLKALETWEQLADIAQNEDENSFVRMYAAEAIGAMEKEESIDILINLFDSNDPNLRSYVLKGLSYFTNKKVQDVIVIALKDNHYKVRLEAVEVVKKQKITAAAPYLRYRAEHDTEKKIIYACNEALVAIGDQKGIDSMIEILKDEKKNDVIRTKIAENFLKNKVKKGYDAVIEATKQSLDDSRYKKLSYALGKLFAKYPNSAWKELCALYLESEDVAAKGCGLEIYDKNRYSSLTSMVKDIEENDESAAMKRKATLILEKE